MANVTLRTYLTDSVSAFCDESGLPFVTPELLTDLIVRLSRYREEGVKLSPQVYLTDSIDFLTNMLPDGERFQLAATTASTDGVTEMLSACAPIATADWRIFGHKSLDEMTYGVFRGSGSPVSVEVDDISLSGPTDAPVIKVHQVANECVQIDNSKGTRHFIFFDHRNEDSPPPLQYVENFILSVTRRVDDRNKDTVRSYLNRIVAASLSAGHGCIWAVTTMARPPRILKDGIFFSEPIDFQGLIDALKARQVTLDSLDRKAELVRGMLCCDGISLFDERAKLLGYHCFVPRSPGVRVVGGARRRAFATLKTHLGRGLAAVFMQSQDGQTEFEGTIDD